ncbi:MAG: polyprenyl synthetase family protein [Chloroflexi bacterium]|nr:polyprenyl synthetase family protein [Chloroflexota bacterium]MDA1219705.1 polyprenyl synthetase family protein [Chloroflexota bacterium]
MFGRYRDVVAQELSRAVPASGDTDLTTLMQYHLGWVDHTGAPAITPSSQGKALRPTLCMFACEALRGDLQHALPAAAALELIHNFSLIHDDIQDQDLERRHQATVWALWGIPKALVAGDAMQSLGDLEMLGCNRSSVAPSVTLKVSEILTESYLEMIEGQCLDLGFESRADVTAGDYLQMIACKTGALIRSALHIGALLATDNRQSTDAFARFGSYLGRAFQVRDDYLGIWGDENATGKSSDNDIRRRKKSLPVVFAFEKASGGSKDDLIRIYGQESLDDSDVERVTAILEEVGAPEYAESLTQESAELAVKALAQVDLPNWARAEVEELVDFLAHRQY